MFCKTYREPPFCEKDILRYAGCREADGEITALVNACIEEVRGKLVYKVCYRPFEVKIGDGVCDFGDFSFPSADLACNLKGCERAVLFAATVGVEIDRLIARYGRISPTKALILQAIGAERIEALCDLFCEDIAEEYGVGAKPRFSPGYGDLPLETQREFFAVLAPEKRIGLTLTDSLMLSPSKSVTAIVGLGGGKVGGKGDEGETTAKCRGCTMKNCTFRGAL